MAGKKKEQLDVATRKAGYFRDILGLEPTDFDRVQNEITTKSEQLRKSDDYDLEPFRALKHLEMLELPDEMIDGERLLRMIYLHDILLRDALEHTKVTVAVVKRRPGGEPEEKGLIAS